MLPQFDMNTKKDIHQLMEDVRKAHRIIYQFQDRMLQLMNRIANDYGLNHPDCQHNQKPLLPLV